MRKRYTGEATIGNTDMKAECALAMNANGGGAIAPPLLLPRIIPVSGAQTNSLI